MKSSNYYKRLALILSLAVLLLLFVTSCESSGSGSEETTDGGSSGETTVIDVPSGPIDSESKPVDPPVSSGSESDAVTDPEGTEPVEGTETNKPTDTDKPTESTKPAGGVGTAIPSDGPLDSNPSDTSSSSGNPTDPATVTFTVTVLDSAGNPQKNVVVKLSNGKQGVTNANGMASIKTDSGSYTFTLEKIGAADGDYTYNTASCVLSMATQSVTVVFDEKVSGAGTLGSQTLIFDIDGDGVFTEYVAPYVTDGTMSIDVKAGGITYFIFVPQRSGQYRFSVTSDSASVSVGYYGAPHYIHANNVATMIGDYFEFNIRASHVGASLEQTSKWVIGVKTADGSAATATLKIERFADALLDSADAPWDDVLASSQYLTQCPDYQGTLTDIDITKNVMIGKGRDGKYHFDLNGDGIASEDEPIVMIHIVSASPYIDALDKICDTSVLPCYYYDSNGNFQRKEQYNDFVKAYAACANEDGVVVLNDELIAMMEKVGGHMGWWNPTHPQYLFENYNLVEEDAWLFMCCYYA